MPEYKAPLRDMRFVLHELLEVEKHQNLPIFSEAPADIIDAVLEEGAKVAEEILFPLNQVGHEEGCTFKDGEVTTPTGFKEAFAQYREGGWIGLAGDANYGGMGLPAFLGSAFGEMTCSTNLAFEMYSGLTSGACAAIAVHGTEEQKSYYLPRMYSGEWTGTMNLTEPHCGTDLGQMRTKAESQDDGSYLISGTKIFISAGDHDMADNIVHLVLAKIPGGPKGIKGVSLFIVPKVHSDAEGNLGERNGVSTGSIEHKMGINGNATCVLNYDKAQGWLLGREHKGMEAMFVMMNAARLGVGMQGLSLSEVSYQNAVLYANDRLQGRSLSGVKEPEKAADPIIVHPDVRRMLMTMRSFNEGARGFIYWVAMNLDLARAEQDEEARQVAEDLVTLITPVVKAHITDVGFECANIGQQCFGGHGYIREHGMEQYVRDARIAQLYEGTNGIQALDLVGRKMPAHMGRLLRAFFHPVDAFIQENADNDDLEDFIMPLAKGFARLQQAVAWLGEQGMKDVEQAAAGATDFQRMFGTVALGFMWARMAKVAQAKLAAGTDEVEFYENKLKTGRFYMARTMPDTSSLLAKVTSGKDTLMALDAAAF
jgi:alkylation response protein AidB-like acyl-CoA dehydrogenase